MPPGIHYSHRREPRSNTTAHIPQFPRDAQRAVPSDEVASQARSIGADLLDKGARLVSKNREVAAMNTSMSARQALLHQNA